MRGVRPLLLVLIEVAPRRFGEGQLLGGGSLGLGLPLALDVEGIDTIGQELARGTGALSSLLQIERRDRRRGPSCARGRAVVSENPALAPESLICSSRPGTSPSRYAAGRLGALDPLRRQHLISLGSHRDRRPHPRATPGFGRWFTTDDIGRQQGDVQGGKCDRTGIIHRFGGRLESAQAFRCLRQDTPGGGGCGGCGCCCVRGDVAASAKGHTAFKPRAQ